MSPEALLAENAAVAQSASKARAVSVAEILKAVAEVYSRPELPITVKDLKGERRPAHIAGPRQMAMYLCRELTRLSFPEIGEAIGGKDHTTVLHACDAVTARLRDDPQAKVDEWEIRNKLGVAKGPCPSGSVGRIGVDAIKEMVARKFGVSVEAIDGTERTDWVALARHVAIYLYFRMSGLCEKAVGEAFGGYDHRTVSNALDNVTTRMRQDGDVKGKVLELECDLGLQKSQEQLSLNLLVLVSSNKARGVEQQRLRELVGRVKLAVCCYFQPVTAAEIDGHSREGKNLVDARQTAMYLAMLLSRGSSRQLAEFFGKTHGALSHAASVVAARIGNDAEFARKVRAAQAEAAGLKDAGALPAPVPASASQLELEMGAFVAGAPRPADPILPAGASKVEKPSVPPKKRHWQVRHGGGGKVPDGSQRSLFEMATGPEDIGMDETQLLKNAFIDMQGLTSLHPNAIASRVRETCACSRLVQMTGADIIASCRKLSEGLGVRMGEPGWPIKLREAWMREGEIAGEPAFIPPTPAQEETAMRVELLGGW